jgi:hypothetical protein
MGAHFWPVLPEVGLLIFERKNSLNEKTEFVIPTPERSDGRRNLESPRIQ